MLQHHIQQEIVRSLASSEGMRFSELKPADTENKLFNYHLKITIRDGYVEKSQDGIYSLTIEGRRLGSRNFNKPSTIADSAYSVLFLVIRRKSDNSWLLYKRNTHPLLGKSGFIHAVPSAEKSVVDSAKQQTQDKTGLICDFTPLGGGFIKTFNDDMLEGHVNFTLLYCDDAQGELKNQDSSALFYWEDKPDFSAKEMIPNMELLSSLYEEKKPFFIDEKLFL